MTMPTVLERWERSWNASTKSLEDLEIGKSLKNYPSSSIITPFLFSLIVIILLLIKLYWNSFVDFVLFSALVCEISVAFLFSLTCCLPEHLLPSSPKGINSKLLHSTTKTRPTTISYNKDKSKPHTHTYICQLIWFLSLSTFCRLFCCGSKKATWIF